MAVKRFSDDSSIKNTYRLSRGIISVAKPTQPTITNIVDIGVTTASVEFTPSLLGPVATSFTVSSIPSGGSGSGSTSPILVEGLSPSTSYVFLIKATNANGDSVNSTPSNSINTVASQNFTTHFLVIGGGGGSGGFGGGGAGGYRTSFSTSGRNSSAENALSLSTGSNYSVTVGGGGSNSVFSTITSLGGGSGGGYGNGGNGGSGGGGTTGGAYFDAAAGGVGTTGQGFDGGRGHASARGSGGGGGAGGNGITPTGTNTLGSTAHIGGAGGVGLSSSITGTSVMRGGGGGGGGSDYWCQCTPTALGGSGGGGNGGDGVSQNGTVNTGGGGGGTFGSTPPGGNRQGGSGVVILRYPNTRTITLGAGLIGSTSSVDSDKVTTITAGTGNVSWL